MFAHVLIREIIMRVIDHFIIETCMNVKKTNVVVQTTVKKV